MASFRPWFTALACAGSGLFGCCAHDNAVPSATPPQSPAPTQVPAPNPIPPPMPTPPSARDDQPAPATKAVATFASGCFWCTEAVLEQQDGVLDVVSGYMGGALPDPTYEQVCSGETGHAECVQVTFDPARISYATLLDWFFRSHDPTSLNRQGADVGTQYRSAVFYHSDEQKLAVQAAIKALQPKYGSPIVTEISPAVQFWRAEDYHQDYFKKHPNQGYCRAVIAPKLKKLGLPDAK